MVVVIVVGILAAAAVPIYRFAMSRAYSSEAKATMGTMMSSMKVFAAETTDGSYPLSVFGTSADTPSVLTNLGVDTKTNTWWHAPPDTTTTCVFGSTAAGTWPTGSGFSEAPTGATATGPYVWAQGNVEAVTTIYGIKMVYDMGADEWHTSF